MLERCLDSLSAGGGSVPRVIVADNGGESSGTSGLEAAYPGLEVVRLPENRGYAGGCNEGLRRVSSAYVVFMNDDAVVEPGWLEPLVAEAERDASVGALQPKILSLKARRDGRRLFDYAGAAGGMLDRLGYPWCLGRSFSGIEEDRGQYDEPSDLFWASGVALFGRTELFRALGGFEEGFFMHMEEIDLCWRLRLRGMRIRSVPASVVWHEGGASLGEGSPLKVYYNHRNALAMFLRNRCMSSLLLLLPLRVFLEPVAALYYLITAGPHGLRCAAQVLRAGVDNLRGLRRTLRQRKYIQRERVVDDRLLFAGAPWSMFLARVPQPAERASQ